MQKFASENLIRHYNVVFTPEFEVQQLNKGVTLQLCKLLNNTKYETWNSPSYSNHSPQRWPVGIVEDKQLTFIYGAVNWQMKA